MIRLTALGLGCLTLVLVAFHAVGADTKTQTDCQGTADAPGEGAGIHINVARAIRVTITDVQAKGAVKFTLQNDVHHPEVDLKAAEGLEYTYPGPVKLSVCSTEPGSGGGCWATPIVRPGFAEFRTPGGHYTVQMKIACQ
jgi:hypothetical protein